MSNRWRSAASSRTCTSWCARAAPGRAAAATRLPTESSVRGRRHRGGGRRVVLEEADELPVHALAGVLVEEAVAFLRFHQPLGVASLRPQRVAQPLGVLDGSAVVLLSVDEEDARLDLVGVAHGRHLVEQALVPADGSAHVAAAQRTPGDVAGL